MTPEDAYFEEQESEGQSRIKIRNEVEQNQLMNKHELTSVDSVINCCYF